MMDAVRDDNADQASAGLHDALFRADLSTAEIPPVLLHLLENDARHLLSAEVVARVRAVLQSLADELVNTASFAGFKQKGDASSLVAMLQRNSLILCYVHALVLEGVTVQRLEKNYSISSKSPAVVDAIHKEVSTDLTELLRDCLLAQNRFLEAHQSLQLALVDLPDEIHKAALNEFQKWSGDPHIADAKHIFSDRSDHGKGSRSALLHELVTHSAFPKSSGLDLAQTGFSIFVSALAAVLQQDRELVILAASDSNSVRLALSLRSAGLSAEAVQRCIWLLHPDAPVPYGTADLSVEDAHLVLNQSLYQR